MLNAIEKNIALMKGNPNLNFRNNVVGRDVPELEIIKQPWIIPKKVNI